MNETQNQRKVTFSRNDYNILMGLYNSECFTELRALPIRNIQDIVGLSPNKIRQALKTFLEVGYISEGATIGRAKTYYVTDEGKQKSKEISK